MSKQTMHKRVGGLYSSLLLSSLLLPMSTSLVAQNNTLDLKSTFKGNQEQPKVMYIVPWQAIEAPPASYRPVSSLIAENFQMLDREEFQRNVYFSDYLEQAGREEIARYNSHIANSAAAGGTASGAAGR